MTLWVENLGEFNWTIFLFHVASTEVSRCDWLAVHSPGRFNMAPLTCLEPWGASLNDLPEHVSLASIAWSLGVLKDLHGGSGLPG